MEPNQIIQKREPSVDTGPWVPGVTPFLFSLLMPAVCCCLVIFSLQSCSSTPPPEVSLELVSKGDFLIPQLQVSQEDFQEFEQEQWEQAFRIYVGDSLPVGEMLDYPILGTYTWQEGIFSFRPRLSWQPNQDYYAYFDPQKIAETSGENQQSSQSLVFRFFPPTDTSHASVSAILPSEKIIPSNSLRLYLYFDSPMRQDSVYQYVKLRDENNELIPQAFVEAQPPLFDPSGKRLTLIFHPGRVKQGIEFGERMGPVLLTETNYQLVIDSLWKDKGGRTLQHPYVHHFSTSQADRQSPNPDQWNLQYPALGSETPLHVTFDDQLDAVLAKRMIRLTNNGVGMLFGNIEADARTWTFTPENGWQPGIYQLKIDHRLEDLAGNRLGRLFDSKEEKGKEEEWVISFELE